VATPVLQALLLADYVYQDRLTGKHVICGVFNTLIFVPPEQRESGAGATQAEVGESLTISAAELIRAGSPHAYISLTELQGTKKLELRYVDLSENIAMFSTTFQLKSQDPLQTVEIAVPLPPLPAPREGTFALELLCDDEMLGSHRVLVKRNSDTR